MRKQYRYARGGLLLAGCAHAVVRWPMPMGASYPRSASKLAVLWCGFNQFDLLVRR